MRQRKLGLAAFLAVMLSILMASTAMAAPPVSNSGSPDDPVQLNANINDQPAVFDVTEIATDPDGDPLEVASGDGTCGYQDATHFNYYPWFVGNQESCYVLVKDDEGNDADPDNDNYVSVYINITTTSDDVPPLDTIDPVVDITSPAEGISVATNSVVINYTATDNVGIDSCNVANGGSVSLTPGPNAITINCEDAVGNVGSDTVNVIYDAVAPVVTITSPADGSTLTISPAALAYTVDDQDSSPTCSQVNGSNVTLDEGLNEITVECTDAAGNTGSDTVNVTYEPPPPSVPTLTVNSAIVTEGDPGQTQVYAKFQVTLSNAWNQDIDILYWALPGTAGTGDFQSNILIPKVKTIPAGATSTEIWIPIKADTKKEKDELFFLLYLSCDIGAAGVTTGIIKDDAGG